MAAALRPDPETRFTCSLCARCCTSRFEILMREDDARALRALPLATIGRDAGVVLPAGGGLFKLAKAADGRRCALLDDDDLCALHKAFGEASKPTACRRFPYLTVASDQAVWATANYGCKAVGEGRGAPLSEQAEALGALFARDLAEADPEAPTRYPLGPALERPDAEVEALFEALIAAMGHRFFPALRQLAAFAEACHGDAPPGPGEPEAPRREPPARAPLALRRAFALTLYPDLLDPFARLDRLRGVWLMPRLPGFEHRYTSRLLERPVSMRQVAHHPGALPLAGERRLMAWLRSRLRARRVFQGVPHAAAGVVRLLLHADLVVYLARARAGDAAISDEDVLEALARVELYVANQPPPPGLEGPLAQAWSDPGLARPAAQLFTPSDSWGAHSVTVQA